jgi:hypothetical protein
MPKTSPQIRKGVRVRLTEDLVNLDGSIVIQPAGAEGDALRNRHGIATVRFDDGSEHVVFVWKLERVA